MKILGKWRNYNSHFSSWESRPKDASQFGKSPTVNWRGRASLEYISYSLAWGEEYVYHKIKALSPSQMWSWFGKPKGALWSWSQAASFRCQSICTQCTLEVKTPNAPNAFLLIPEVYLEDREYSLFQALVLICFVKKTKKKTNKTLTKIM